MLTQLSHPYTRCHNCLIPKHIDICSQAPNDKHSREHPPPHTHTHHYSHVLMQWPRLTWLYPTNSPSESKILKLTIPPWVAMSSKWPLWYNTHTGWLLQCLSWFSSLYTIWARRKVCCDTRNIDCAMLFTALNPWQSARMPRNGTVPCSNLQMVKGQVE